MPLSLVVPATVTVRRPAAGVKRGLHDTGEDRRRLGGGAHGQVQAGVDEPASVNTHRLLPSETAPADGDRATAGGAAAPEKKIVTRMHERHSPVHQLNLPLLARHPSSYHARAAMRRQSGALVSVNIHLTRFEDPIELIAHEIEHVIEQLEGVDLEAQAGTGNVWKREDGAFETRRAIEVGRRVAREVNAAEDPTASDGPEDSVSLRLTPSLSTTDSLSLPGLHREGQPEWTPGRLHIVRVPGGWGR